ncbi:MAG: RNA polymerase sigma factor [Phycisphaerae bacterium]
MNSIVAAASRNDASAKEALFLRFRDVAYRVAMRITGRHADAMDVVQDAFIRAFANLERFQGDSSFKTWFLRIVSNRALDLLRKRNVRLAISLDGGDESGPQIANRDVFSVSVEEVGAELEDAEMVKTVQDAIDALPPAQKSVISLYATGDMTYGEIADVLGVPIGTIMSRLYHARKRLREMLPELASQFSDAEGAE